MEHMRSAYESMTDESRKDRIVISALEIRGNCYHENASACSDNGGDKSRKNTRESEFKAKVLILRFPGKHKCNCGIFFNITMKFLISFSW